MHTKITPMLVITCPSEKKLMGDALLVDGSSLFLNMFEMIGAASPALVRSCHHSSEHDLGPVVFLVASTNTRAPAQLTSRAMEVNRAHLNRS